MAIQMEPSFTVTLRGYDKEEVDAYTYALRELHDEALRRMEEAQDQVREIDSVVRRLLNRVGELEACLRNESPRTIDALGERITLVLQEAEAGASDALAQARTEADDLVANARRQADAILSQATVQATQAEDILSGVQREAQEQAARIEEAAHAHGSEIVADAERRATARLDQVEAWARTVIEKTQAEHARLNRDFEDQWTTRQAELRILVARHEQAVAHINGLQTALRRTVEDARGAHDQGLDSVPTATDPERDTAGVELTPTGPAGPADPTSPASPTSPAVEPEPVSGAAADADAGLGRDDELDVEHWLAAAPAGSVSAAPERIGESAPGMNGSEVHAVD